tara:strand:- start:1618 stop:2121 length:504 start_codon:yes stop_codon:yes gene_type:complete
MYYAQTKTDEIKLNNFRAVITKYHVKLLEGIIIKKPNAIYPRLICSKLRGIKAGDQLVKNLCDGLINNADPSILFDIINNEIGINLEYNIPFSSNKLSFINLQQNIPNYILRDDDYYIDKLICNNYTSQKKLQLIQSVIKKSNLNFDEINNICHFLMRQGKPFRQQN